MAIYPQPGVPFAKIYFGNVEVTSFPDLSLQSFEYNRGDSQHGGNSVQFTLIDQEWTTLELLLLKAKGAIEFEYGWIDDVGPSQSWSTQIGPRYKMSCTKYQIKITNEHIELIVEGKSQADVKNPVNNITPGQTNKVYPSRISELAIKVYDDLGMDTGGVEIFDKYERRHNQPNSTIPNYQENLIPSTNPTQYINQELVFRATGEGLAEGGAYLYFEDFPKPKVFLTRSWKPPKKMVKTFYIPEGLEYEVITFEPDINLPSTLAGEGTAQKALRGISQQRGRTTINTFRHRVVNTGIGNPEHVLDYKNVDGANNSPQNQIFEESFSTPGESKQAITSFYSDRANRINIATLSIVGDPTYSLMNGITIIVRKSGAGGGGLHYTTGVYLIVGIKDSISPGTYQTTFSLKKQIQFDKLFEKFLGKT